MTTRGLSPLPILAELDTQLIIAEMQGYAPYAHGMKSRIIGLMAAIRKFATALRKSRHCSVKAQMHFCSDAQMPRSVKTAQRC